MLHCIIGMVDKAKRTLAVLQERSTRDREEMHLWMRRESGNHGSSGGGSDVKKRPPEISSYRHGSDDRLADVKRRAGMRLLSKCIIECI